jgi:hypothetical protein
MQRRLWDALSFADGNHQEAAAQAGLTDDEFASALAGLQRAIRPEMFAR